MLFCLNVPLKYAFKHDKVIKAINLPHSIDAFNKLQDCHYSVLQISA